MAFIGQNFGDKVRIGYDDSTGEVGMQYKMLNKTGTGVAKGAVLAPHASIAHALANPAASGLDPCFICYDTGVADGGYVWVWTTGARCQVYSDATVTLGTHTIMKTSATPALAAPDSFPIVDAAHFQEIGHPTEGRTGAGLVMINFHQN